MKGLFAALVLPLGLMMVIDPVSAGLEGRTHYYGDEGSSGGDGGSVWTVAFIILFFFGLGVFLNLKERFELARRQRRQDRLFAEARATIEDEILRSKQDSIRFSNPKPLATPESSKPTIDYTGERVALPLAEAGSDYELSYNGEIVYGVELNGKPVLVNKDGIVVRG